MRLSDEEILLATSLISSPEVLDDHESPIQSALLERLAAEAALSEEAREWNEYVRLEAKFRRTPTPEVVELKARVAELEQQLEAGGAEWSRMATQYDELMGKALAHDKMMTTPTKEWSDGMHTFGELYEYRMVYHAMAAQWWLENGHPVVKSWHHSDGEKCFGGGWFVVVADLEGVGQVSNHYAEEHWDVFDVPEVERPPEYDGHTPAVALERLWMMLEVGR